MASPLVTAADSNYVSAQNSLKGSGELPETIMFVEGLDDIAFWRECTRPFSTTRRFSIMMMRNADNSFVEGKSNLLGAVDFSTLGRNLLLAVDADYDWIIDGYKTSPTSVSYSNDIVNNPYILHTYLYSTENFRVYPSCVDTLLVKATACSHSVDCEKYFSICSKVLAPLFLIHLVSAERCDDVYNLKAFREDVDKVRISPDTFELTQNSKRHIEKRIALLKPYSDIHIAEIEAYKNKLLSRGFDSDKYHLLFRGHDVSNIIVRNRFENLVFQLRKKQLDVIRSNPKQEQRQQMLVQYSRVTGIDSDIDTAKPYPEKLSGITKAIEFYVTDCSMISRAIEGYDRIMQDLSRLYP